MTIAKAPVRISFAGGGTDIQPYCSDYGGCCIAAAIRWYNIAVVDCPNTAPSPMEAAISSFLGINCNIKIYSSIPTQSGLGGSAAACVAGLKAAKPTYSRMNVAMDAFHVERNIMGVIGGIQDQFEATYGGLLFLEFGANNRVNIERMRVPSGFEKRLYLVYLGKRNNSGHDIIKDQLSRYDKAALHRTKELTLEMRRLLRHDKLDDFGSLMDEAWQTKKQFSPFVTTPEIDSFYDWAMSHGAIAGKLTGAGGGGYMLLMSSADGSLARELALANTEFSRVHFDNEGVTLWEEREYRDYLKKQEARATV